MYINPFWCGVGATTIVEVVAIITCLIYYNKNEIGGRK